jgi:hypothetical protein
MKPVRILFAVENREEFGELITLVRELLSVDRERHCILFKTHPLFQLQDYTTDHDSEFENRYIARNPYGRNFKNVSIFKKIILILVNTVILLRLARRYRITHILSGVPLIFHRVIKLFFPAIIHFAYIRGLLLLADKATSVSDRFYFLTGRIHSFRSIRFFNNYFADHIFTIGEINKNTLLARRIPASRIYISGPLLLDQYRRPEQGTETSGGKKELIYITQAYLWHLDTHGHQEQLTSIRSLLKYLAESSPGQFDLTIRVHPRDSQQIYRELLDRHSFPGRIDQSPPAGFLQQVSQNRVLVSGLSTLAFEWIYLGGYCIFYSTQKLFKISQAMYEHLNISPCLDPASLVARIQAGDYLDGRDQINRIFYRHPSSNLQFIVDRIDGLIGG